MTTRKLRSVAQLKLWNRNPRLDPSQTYRETHSFVEGICNASAGDKDGLMKLIESISKRGFESIDPIVVWKDPKDGRFCVAEGNRRVLALKLLLTPDSAPASIRTRVKKLSEACQFKKEFKKIYVVEAPSFDAVRWYIAQRHSSTTSLQEPWNREQQYRYVTDLYDAYDHDIERVSSTLGLPASEILDMVRVLKLKKFAASIPDTFSPDEWEIISSPKFALSTLERFIKYSSIKERLGIEPAGDEFKSSRSQKDFKLILSTLVKQIASEDISSRSSESDVLEALPEPSDAPTKTPWSVNPDSHSDSNVSAPAGKTMPMKSSTASVSQKDNPKRNRLIPDIFSLGITSTRIVNLFEELKNLPLSRYPNATASSLRVLLDLSVHSYLERNSLFAQLRQQFNASTENIPLKRRLEFLKGIVADNNSKKIIAKLLAPDNEFSLDVLNGYVHSESNAFVDKVFLNRFFDFLVPLLKELDDITETEN